MSKILMILQMIRKKQSEDVKNEQKIFRFYDLQNIVTNKSKTYS